MMPLSSWLDCVWRHNSVPERETVTQAARILDQQVWDRHKIKLLYCDDAWHFRTISTEEVKRAQRIDMGLGDADFPQLGMHADPTCRHLTSENFFGLIGTKTDRPLPLYTMNTAAVYRMNGASALLCHLFEMQTLWSDSPERDCADLKVRIDSTSPDFFWALPAVHLGTAWTHEDRRGKGIMRTVSQLHRLVAWLRFGPIPQFATVVPNAGSEKVFGGRDIGAVMETRDGLTKETRVLFWSPEDLLSSAKAVLNPTET